jgi:lipopolysaccharide export system permease protein
MKPGILDRYLLREAGGAWLAVTLVLLAIMLATRFARFLGEAATGVLPRELLFKVVALSSLQYLVILIPVSLLLAIMLALGRLYKDNEIAAMHGCGVGLSQFYRPFIGLGLALTLLAALLAFYIGPWAGRTSEYISKDAARFVQYNPFEVGRFKEVADGRAVFYTSDMSDGGQKLGEVFAQLGEVSGKSLLIAKSGRQTVNPLTGRREITLENGFRYRGEPGKAGFEIMRYAELTTHVEPPAFAFSSNRRRIYATHDLIHSADPEDQAELQWRIAMPISVLVLVLLAVPLSHIGPRQGRYGKLVLGIVIYLAYSQLIGAAETWISRGIVPASFGMWWVHALVLGYALWLIGQRSNWWRRA